MAFLENWTLETIFPGGVEGESFKLLTESLKQRVQNHKVSVSTLKSSMSEDAPAWRELLMAHRELLHTLRGPSSFASCWASVRTKDPAPRTANQVIRKLFAIMEECEVRFTQQLDGLDDDAFEEFISFLPSEAPFLRNQRATKHLRREESVETVVAQLNPQALHGWGNLYRMVAGRLQATIALEGQTPVEKSIAEVSAMRHHSDESVRKAAYVAMTKAWQTEEDLCAMTLNNITETRIKRNERVGVDELEHTLRRNRLDREALDAMWAACEAARPSMLRYLDRKAALMGHEQIQPWNLRASIKLTEETPLSWDTACTHIIEAFDAFDPEMGAFAHRALTEGWVDSKAAPNRRMGGFCASAPTIEESRIFMTFGHTMRSATTLAHELGHAWHNDVLYEADPSQRSVTSSTAESASTFGEALFRDYMFARAESDAVRIQMLDQELIAGVSFLMDLPIRYEFERALYLLAEEGPFTAKRLIDTWQRLWKQGFGGRLASTTTHGWCSTLHYYITHFGFYNWPYTFGYLFSSHITQQARQVGPSYNETLSKLLIGTGHAYTVPLAQEVLGVDLRDKNFWIQTIQPLLDIEKRFMAMTEPLVAKNISEA